MLKYCKLSEYRQRKLQELFLAGVSARKASEIAGVHRNSATRFFKKLRILISENLDTVHKLSREVDECYIVKQRNLIPL